MNDKLVAVAAKRFLLSREWFGGNGGELYSCAQKSRLFIENNSAKIIAIATKRFLLSQEWFGGEWQDYIPALKKPR